MGEPERWPEESEAKGGDPLGTHRVLQPHGVLPQPAWRLDNDTSRPFETEIVVHVDILNIDAASFRQMMQSAGESGIAKQVMETVASRGKQHNPVTGSGGMLLGRVKRVGQCVQNRGLSVGDRIATLASLSLTPLRLAHINAVHPARAQLDVQGEAIVFASAPIAKMPSDFADRVALALLDVAGAAPQVTRWVRPADTVVVLGAGGKSGVLCAVEARRQVGPQGRVIGVESHAPFAKDLRELGVCDAVLELDACEPLCVRDGLLATGLGEADVTFSCVNVEGVEMSAILVTKQRGKVYFFAMSTLFSRAALGAEGVGKDIDLLIGNGFVQGHAEHTLGLVRDHAALRALFERRYR